MKQIVLPTLLLMLVSSCSLSPDALAKDYCNCRADVEAGKKNMDECKELAESHFLKLQNDDAAMKTYTEKVFDCISSTQIKTE